jgi:imidazolonepropionase
VGHLRPGARADVLMLDAPSHIHLAYRPGVPLVERVWRNGQAL